MIFIITENPYSVPPTKNAQDKKTVVSYVKTTRQLHKYSPRNV